MATIQTKPIIVRMDDKLLHKIKQFQKKCRKIAWKKRAKTGRR